MCPSLIKDIAIDNNPCKVKSEKDNALYWVRSDGSPLSLSFPAILDTHGKYGRTGPYFNMMDNVRLFFFFFHLTTIYSLYIQLKILQQADENNFKRTKALFELNLLPPLTANPTYPPEAHAASMGTWMALTMLCEEVEDRRNKGITFFSLLFLSRSNLLCCKV